MQHTIIRRGLARLIPAVASAIVALGALATVDASAAGAQDARPSNAAGNPHLAMPQAVTTGSRAAAPNARPNGYVPRTVGFRNSYGKTVSVAIMQYDPDRCGGYGNWRTRGWWVLAPGEEKRAMTTTNGYAAYYARAVDGTQWAGDYGPVSIYDRVFDSCSGIGSSQASAVVGMRLIDLRSAGFYHYVNLIP
jgi:hypothetical protein